jgi:glutamate-1-semialdehyde 2,1-aminomutase
MYNETTSILSNEPGVPHELSFAKSKIWFDRAKKVLAGGVSSSARMPASGTLQIPLYVTSGKGSRILDVDGNEYVDHLLSYGSLIAGHCNPILCEAIELQTNLGAMFGTCNTIEVELAEQICRMVPCAELVRYANSGSEAIAGAIRAARGFTGKNKILKFEGHYHGWIDLLAVSNRPPIEKAGPFECPSSHPHSMGIPAGVVDDIIICPWNEPEILKNILSKYGDQFAAVIAEPIVANSACIMPLPGFLELLREECSRRGIILIFDEIVTGFRAAPGGAQQYFGIDCDIAVFSKALGGGMPISAFAGKRRIMEPIAKNTVKHGGTYNGNPLSAIVSLETLRIISNEATLRHMHNLGQTLIETIKKSAKDNKISCIVQGLGTMFQVLFTDRERITNYRDLFDVDAEKFGIFRDALLENGLHINSSYSACWFISSVHHDLDIEIDKNAIKAAMKKIKDR